MAASAILIFVESDPKPVECGPVPVIYETGEFF